MFCEKCGAEITDDAQFCAKCGKKTSLGLPVEKRTQASSLSRKLQEHVLARAEKSWAPLISAIIWSAAFLALYFFCEAWFIEPKFREIAVSIAKQSDRYLGPVEYEQFVRQFVGTNLNFFRIPIIIIEVISVALNVLVRARQFLYITNKRIIGNSGRLIGKRELNLPFAQINDLKILKSFSVIPYTSIHINTFYIFQIKEGQEFRLLLERLVREAKANKGASTNPPPLQQNRQGQQSVTSHRVNDNGWICGKCGAHNSNSDSFCNDCGSYK